MIASTKVPEVMVLFDRRNYISPPTYGWLRGNMVQLVAVKQIKMSRADHMYKLERAVTREVFLEAWLISPWEPHGNIGEFIGRHKLEVPEKLSLIHDTALAFLHQMNPPICHGDLNSANVLIHAELGPPVMHLHRGEWKRQCRTHSRSKEGNTQPSRPSGTAEQGAQYTSERLKH
ncbi:hypothetical protein M407DRAFT_27007 [Tulasnella calospora MUT 4182]|uniref:Protein kinase domain-containing protein n=1 Tax=Tulasnella calospora MUT 4182 TaxID=1051891 RepID=A0A0C3QDA5_9AGAM|nr:hypothetical protein M407DRAFT_27007 [Tulasnella calospora MUT 4182]